MKNYRQILLITNLHREKGVGGGEREREEGIEKGKTSATEFKCQETLLSILKKHKHVKVKLSCIPLSHSFQLFHSQAMRMEVESPQ